MRQEGPAKRRSTVWIALILLLGSLYLFWILPFQLGKRPVQVEFVPAPESQAPSASPSTNSP